MTPADIERPQIYIVTWFDETGTQHCQQAPNEQAARNLTIEKQLYYGPGTAGWDRVDPLSGGDTNEGIC